MSPYFKLFCLSIVLVCQFLLLVNYVNGATSFGNLQVELTRKITEEKDKKVGLQSTLGQQINQEIKLNQSQGIVKRIETIQKISELQVKSEPVSSAQSSTPNNPVLIIK